MYQIYVYSGGVYRFDELLEFVEDVGGILLHRDDFHLSRGVYFISQEVRVIIIIPEDVSEDLKVLASHLKGEIELLEVDYKQKIDVISLIPVYNILSRVGTWVNLDTLNEMLTCPCVDGVCEEFEEISCSINLEKTLEAMCRMDIAEKRISGTTEYRIKK
jgi:hypothetical protein